MRIGFDGKRAAQNFTGLGNYSRYVIRGVLNHSQPNKYYIYIPRVSSKEEYTKLIEGRCSEITPKGFIWRKLPALWRSFGITRAIKTEKIDIFHGLSNELPFGIKSSGARSIVTIHDLIFLPLPHCYKPLDRFIYNIKFKYACRASDKIVAVSECTKRDIVKYYGIDASKIEVIYQGCNTMFAEQISINKLNEVKKEYNLPDRFILNVGSIETRKNLFLIVKALKYLPEEVSIVAVGKSTKYSKMIERYLHKEGLNGRVLMLHNVKYRDLPAIYRNATIFAYPSYYEGFGIPIIEAIYCGLPVIGATGSCLEEAGGDGAVYVNPDSVEEFAEVANKMLSDIEYCKSLNAKGMEHIKKFDDTLLSQKMIELYDKVEKG